MVNWVNWVNHQVMNWMKHHVTSLIDHRQVSWMDWQVLQEKLEASAGVYVTTEEKTKNDELYS